MAERHLVLFQYMQDGNLGRGLRKLKNLPEPVTPEPVKEEASVAVDPAEVEEKSEGKDLDVDLALIGKQSVSTSSPTLKQKEIEEPEDGEEVENEETKMEA
jgi:hypothetical protein